MRPKRELVIGLLLAVALQGSGTLDMKSGAVVYFGSPGFTSRPASVKRRTVEAATDEFRTIRRDGVSSGSARHSLLTSQMERRLRAVAQELAKASGYDCVVDVAGIRDAGGLDVADITRAFRDRVRAGGGSRSIDDPIEGANKKDGDGWVVLTVVVGLVLLAAAGFAVLRRRGPLS